MDGYRGFARVKDRAEDLRATTKREVYVLSGITFMVLLLSAAAVHL